MECFGSRLLLLHVFLFLLFLQLRSDEEQDLLEGINSFRNSAKAPALVKHDKADCVADEIADKMEDKSCASNAAPTTLMSDYPAVLEKCKVDANTTVDGMILPVCVPKRTATLVLTNYTQSQNARYLNDSKFTGAGIGAEEDWTVLVLTTNTQGGSFASRSHRCVAHYVPSFILSMLSIVFIF
ncbi:uncharacterized GPI-anchored protein At3g06035-like [Salvia miltiorrhiza]|uniref:uncharacterized GPI-anchored protein At3g06035-like n=1 Tax=Salvia miltiorrhiza TaxID=226208 RepID=UPI0025AD788E|nr:uncharacterized GPI-anchored protein At3g06035-like [Salvia miltiorrhiza]